MSKITDGVMKLDELHPHLRNYNNHGKPGAIERMANKMRHTAFTAPCIVTPQGIILGGHLRRLGLMKLRSDSYAPPEGIGPEWEVPVRIFEGTEPQELAILLADNPDKEDIDYDPEGLTALLADVANMGVLDATGYSQARLDEMIGSLIGPSIDDKESPDEFPKHDEKIETTFCCPRCDYRWSGKPDGSEVAVKT